MTPDSVSGHLLRLVLALGAAMSVAVAAGCTADDGAEEAGDLPPEVAAELRGIVEEAADQGVGGTLAYVDTPTGQLALAHGLQDADAEQPPATAAFRVASVTKLLTSAVALQLSEEGALELDDPLAGILAERMEPFEFGDEITLRHVLGHTSGLADFLRNPEYWFELLQRGTIGDGEVTAACGDLADVDPLSFVASESSFAPGDSYEYSNAGYNLAGEAIEEVTGQPLEEAYRERILEPLELESTWLECAEEPRAELVTSFHAPGSFGITIPGQGDEPYEVTGVDDPNLWAAGGLVSTAEDLARFARALFDGALFAEEATLDAMLETSGDDSYGLGVRSGDGTYGHDGLAPGYGTHLHYDPEADTAVVVMVNETSTDLPGEVGRAIGEVLRELDE